jgi:hypothetical protein
LRAHSIAGSSVRRTNTFRDHQFRVRLGVRGSLEEITFISNRSLNMGAKGIRRCAAHLPWLPVIFNVMTHKPT